ncbi:MAG TPA: hypothetical protein VL494_13735 [Steroidobacteraceae bacterium]|nr:hypothetical protein [Steroidobacteraceae bacterium]
MVEAACEPGKSTAYFAVAQFPGKTVSELASVRVLVKFPDDAPTKFPASFAESYTIGVAQLDDGVAAVQCGSATVHAEKVTFTL